MDIFYPFQIIANWLTFEVFQLAAHSHLGESVNFFIYDALKIVLLLLAINYFMAIIRHYFPIEKLRDFLASRKWYGFDHLLASLFGTITPFCSCSSIPLFIGFLKAGIPLGVTFSFLITSPLVNEAAVVLFVGLFGWKITLWYVFAGVFLGVIGGFILGKLKLEKYVADYVWKIQPQKYQAVEKKETKTVLAKKFWLEGWQITKKILPYALAGIALGATIHGFVPTGFLEKHITKDNLFAVPIAVLIAVPMYANATSVIPIMQALV
ncbi:MAG: permease, partial [Candidatus Moraniibacteriota bacterium]